MEIKPPSPVDVLTLGTGWLSTFLLPELSSRKITHASTSRDGANGSIPFTFDPASTDARAYAALPLAKTVLIVFPLLASGAHEVLIGLYTATHPEAAKGTKWIQLGSTSAFDVSSL
jgi:hypothetical protein